MNTLYYGDNLDILRKYISDESVDLIYLDPPFNSKRAYNIIFKDEEGKYPPTQIEAFDDTWQWSDETAETMWELAKPPYPAELYNTLEAFETALGHSNMMAYLVMMAIRLWELKRVLKETGSIYLHCDSTAGHYLKILMDQIYGANCFNNDIIWKRSSGITGVRGGMQHFARLQDRIIFYGKTNTHFFRELYTSYSANTLKMYNNEDERGVFRLQILRNYSESTIARLKNEGRIYIDKNGKRHLKQYLSDKPGVLMSDIWTDIPQIQKTSKESLGYPTQKPVALLERIINASSNEGDIVLDPFCGCGTTVAAAEKLGRKWLGIDITILAINLIEKRINEHFPDVKFEIRGIPNSVASAEKMASTREGKFRFERWFITTLHGQPFKSAGGADSGIDGFMHFRDINGKSHKIIIQVKGGGYNRENIAALNSVVDKENASMGLFLVLKNPTKQSLSEAASAGRYQMPEVERTYPKIQIFTVEDYFKGIRPDLPDISETLKKAKRIKKDREKPPNLI